MEIKIKKVVWELIFVFATVFIFRSTWTLLDKNEFMSGTFGLQISLVAGVVVSLVALHMMHECQVVKRKK